MTWLVLSWYLIAGLTFNDQMILPAGKAPIVWSSPPGSYETTIGGDFIIAEHLYVGGFVRSYETHGSGILFRPYRVDYGASVRVDFGPVRIGLTHECDHPVIYTFGSKPGDQYGQNLTTFFVELQGKSNIF